MTTEPVHFKGKDALGHVAEARARGIITASEMHGTEIPGHFAAAADAARETALALLALWIVLHYFQINSLLPILAISGIGWTLWKAGRSAWLGWSRLERMHRIVEQERFEIQHHRKQERDELRELYREKGFEGKLLEDVLDVLMADEERLLRVMVEEELCLSLETHEHPLKQALGAGVGALLGAFATITGILIWPAYGIWFSGAFTLGLAGGVSAYFEDNDFVPAIVWNIGIGAVASGTIYFLLQYVPGVV